jgi:hypothetical protein
MYQVKFCRGIMNLYNCNSNVSSVEIKGGFLSNSGLYRLIMVDTSEKIDLWFNNEPKNIRFQIPRLLKSTDCYFITGLFIKEGITSLAIIKVGSSDVKNNPAYTDQFLIKPIYRLFA